MNISAIAIRIHPERFDICCATLEERNGVEVYHTDRGSSQIVVIQEANYVDDEIDGLRGIQELPGVLNANLVYHYFEDEASSEAHPES